VENNEFRPFCPVILFLKLTAPSVEEILMTKINFEENFEIYLFNNPSSAMSSSKLNDFLAFLKFHKIGHPYKFSFVSEVASLIPEMTLNQNILIDFSPNSLTESKDVQFQDFLKAEENRALEELYHTLELPHELPGQSNAQMKKVCSLIKSLLYEGEFIFLEAPETDLQPETLKLFINALKERVTGRKINVLISSKNPETWMLHSHYTVERAIDYSFLINKIETKNSWMQERASFYAPTKEKPSENGELTFIHQYKKGKNKAA
jgi:ABC-type lipoprotein export system ATPase subunit